MPGVPSTPSRVNETVNDSSQNPAFLGANHAYRPSSVRSVSTSSTASSSALTAALRAGSRTPEHASPAIKDTPSDMADSPVLSLPQQRAQSRSPSHAAALVAAARASNAIPPTTRQGLERVARKPSIAPKPRTLSDHTRSPSTSSIAIPNDTSSIPPTTSLVSLFERKVNKPDPIVIKPTHDLAIKSPKPRRPDGIRSVFQMEVGSGSGLQSSSTVQDDDTWSGKKEMDFLEAQGRPSIGQEQRRTSKDAGGYYKHTAPKDNDNASTGTSSTQRSSGNKIRESTEVRDFASRSEDNSFRTSAQAKDMKPTLPRRASPPPTKATLRTQTAPIDIRPASRPRLDPDTQPHSQSVSATYRQLYPRKTTPLTDDSELANAIVASSLASSRLSSPQRRDPPPPVPVTRRQSRHFFHSRTPSPVKLGLRTTLRKQDSSESSDNEHPYGKHQKKRIIRKHPNKHHEGDRKRWRDAVTESERKRYEGVWAANKGLFVTPMPSDPQGRSDALNDQVANVVVKDIWNRSRLPDFELETIWDLVDNDGIGRLSKEEFVVGMWLIDQRLKGRKLPVKVTPTVWASVRGLHGIKVRK